MNELILVGRAILMKYFVNYVVGILSYSWMEALCSALLSDSYYVVMR